MGEYVPQTDGATCTKTRQELTRPPMFKVLLYNDHYTTMEFVVQVLAAVFRKPENEAVGIMLNVHRKGVGVCGVYPGQVAETKVARVHQLAQDNGYPLKCSMEPE